MFTRHTEKWSVLVVDVILPPDHLCIICHAAHTPDKNSSLFSPALIRVLFLNQVTLTGKDARKYPAVQESDIRRYQDGDVLDYNIKKVGLGILAARNKTMF
jgi:hypothetical protein